MTAIPRAAGTTPAATPPAYTAPLPGPGDAEKVDLPASYQPLQFHMSTGKQVWGGIIGGVGLPIAATATAGAVMVAGALMNSEGGVNGFLDALPAGDAGGLVLGGIALALVAGGAVGGVFASRAMQHSAFDKRELKREDEQVGKPVARFAEEFLTPYDHSGDGKIQLKNTTGLADRDERLTFETQGFTTKSFHFDPGDHDVFGGNPFGDTTTQHGTEQRAISAANVWTAADADHDEVVTSSELQTFAKTFDANHDGYLNSAERTAMTAQHPLLQGQWTVTEPAS